MDISWITPKIDFDTVDGRRNPAPLGWLKPIQNNGMFATNQMVQAFATIHSRF
jgi:hypothetical protein